MFTIILTVAILVLSYGWFLPHFYGADRLVSANARKDKDFRAVYLLPWHRIIRNLIGVFSPRRSRNPNHINNRFQRWVESNFTKGERAWLRYFIEHVRYYVLLKVRPVGKILGYRWRERSKVESIQKTVLWTMAESRRMGYMPDIWIRTVTILAPSLCQSILQKTCTGESREEFSEPAYNMMTRSMLGLFVKLVELRNRHTYLALTHLALIEYAPGKCTQDYVESVAKYREGGATPEGEVPRPQVLQSRADALKWLRKFMRDSVEGGQIFDRQEFQQGIQRFRGEAFANMDGPLSLLFYVIATNVRSVVRLVRSPAGRSGDCCLEKGEDCPTCGRGEGCCFSEFVDILNDLELSMCNSSAAQGYSLVSQYRSFHKMLFLFSNKVSLKQRYHLNP